MWGCWKLSYHWGWTSLCRDLRCSSIEEIQLKCKFILLSHLLMINFCFYFSWFFFKITSSYIIYKQNSIKLPIVHLQSGKSNKVIRFGLDLIHLDVGKMNQTTYNLEFIMSCTLKPTASEVWQRKMSIITIQAVFLVSSLTAGHSVITRTPPDITAPTITSIHCNHSNCTTHSIYNTQVSVVNHPQYLQHTG